ncbi:T9SS type A sorting domain-containing protein, partial [bacterium]|nr:T9SS type A sorting domain-containing protein [bacterium]
LPRTTHVTLEIYNLLGQRVRTLVDGAIDAGSHTVVWDGRDEFGKIVPTGIYLYRLQSADFVRVRKLVLVR